VGGVAILADDMGGRQVLATFPSAAVWPAGTRRSLWLEDALSHEAARAGSAEGSPATGVAGAAGAGLPLSADVCIVGGGFTGLWAALAVKRRAPDAVVVLLEADICGGGASGRNGGFVMSAWSKFASLRKLCGEADALRYARACERAVGEIGAFCAAQGIDSDFCQAGWLWTATSRAQLDAWDGAIAATAAAGAEPFVRLSPEQVAERSGSARHLGGVFEPAGATFHPAKVARGLAAVARRLGVVVCEHTAVRRIVAGSDVDVQTGRGTVRADAVLLALNAWSAALPQARDALVVTSSDIVATDPIPGRLDALGWEPGLSISDSRRLFTYYQRSREGRVVLGKGGGTLAFGGRVGPGFHGDSARRAEVEAALHFAYPQLSDVPIARSWRGPIDYSVSGLPFLFSVGGHPRVHAATGFSGNGCGPSMVAGEALGAIATGAVAEDFPEALRRVPSSPLPPEPVRWLGGRVVRAAIARKERLEDAGRTPDRATVRLAELDPTGFVDNGDGPAPASRAVSASDGRTRSRQPSRSG
jgi:glycine/D-amino acid oxidase-like deaminating enzyme